MATTATPAATLSSVSCFVTKPVARSSCSVRPVAGLPSLRVVQVRCSADAEQKKAVVPTVALLTSVAASGLALTQPALALVDERLSTEGTGLSLGVSNPLLIWILLAVFGLIWALFFTYAASLKEDDDSGLAL